MFLFGSPLVLLLGFLGLEKRLPQPRVDGGDLVLRGFGVADGEVPAAQDLPREGALVVVGELRHPGVRGHPAEKGRESKLLSTNKIAFTVKFRDKSAKFAKNIAILKLHSYNYSLPENRHEAVGVDSNGGEEVRER